MKACVDHEIEYYKEAFKKQEPKIKEQYFEFLRFPTLSADPSFHPELQACAEWIRNFLEPIGFKVELWNRKTAPVVFASNCKAGHTKPTLLIYNHYDVQPVDPIENWKTDPFQAHQSGNEIYARGAQDNKGQCFYVLSALRSMIENEKGLPINIKLCIEGEEESGSRGLAHLLNEKKEALQADYLLVVDLGMRNDHTPAITLGTRGLVALTVEVVGTNTDLHSGAHGGLVYNPLHALTEMLASLRDDQGRVQVPGFYDTVLAATTDELSRVSLDFNEEEYIEQFGAEATGGEKAYSPIERISMRPTIEINGIHGGYGGPGCKTVIPSRALAKLSCRLVPNQDPLRIGELIKRYLEMIAPKGVKVICTIEEGIGLPIRTNHDSELIQALSSACEKVYWKPCEYIYEGGSIPIIADLAKASGADVAMFGLGLSSDCIHAPNEHFSWDRMEKGFLIISKMVELLGHRHSH